ncbi:hypothetical protein KP003_00975 [Geomonas nitrogeniifigens]|uniref:DUF2059 domain-containing protein n=1 Tax=Geomonas diazotrophica TaxID=2843197 RepID=A0ABX8JJH3_9BACT|nr:hypothetical protein [Geomonas nitrogeniifigens]QWV97873.1 hypothetical protein KP005_00830 [Geomonas nitrogeniifigens]QXE87013.1 hypothetical protein KP003_00975 [Geomonas nitrogeniifigens]
MSWIRFGRCLVAALLLLGAAGVGSAAVAPLTPDKKVERGGELTASREEFHLVVAKLLKDQGFLDKNNTFKKGTKMHRLFESYLQETLSDPAVMDFLYTSLKENAEHVTDFDAFGKALAGEYAVRGLTRLSESDFQELLRVMNVLADRLPVRDCAGMLRPGSAFDYHWLELLPLDDARVYLRLTKQALVAEITRSPRIAANTKEQTSVAYQALYAEIRRRLAPEKLERFGKIWGKPEAAGDEELCWGYRVLLSGILDLPVEPRRWMLREYANLLRPPQ